MISQHTVAPIAVAKAPVARLIPFLFLLYIVVVPRSHQRRVCRAADERGARIFGDDLRPRRRHLLSQLRAFEIPSNVILARVGARLWIARIMITWGLVSAGDDVRPQRRRLLRAAVSRSAPAEAGFFPGIIYYLTRWFPARERARTIAGFMTAIARRRHHRRPDFRRAAVAATAPAAWPAGNGCSCSKGCPPSCSASSCCAC